MCRALLQRAPASSAQASRRWFGRPTEPSAGTAGAALPAERPPHKPPPDIQRPRDTPPYPRRARRPVATNRHRGTRLPTRCGPPPDLGPGQPTAPLPWGGLGPIRVNPGPSFGRRRVDIGTARWKHRRRTLDMPAMPWITA